MSDTNNPNTAGTGHANPTRQRGLGRTLFWAVLIAAAVLAVSRPLTARHSPFGPTSHWSMSRAPAPELEERWNRAADWILERVDATDEQRIRIEVVQSSLMPDLSAYQNEHGALQARTRQALGTNPVDREELERIRLASLDLADRASRRAVDSFAQMLEVLTAEQQKELVELWRR